ncbi:LOW QUALITY PROTEIN: basic proline-rich protein-like [Tachyglossus aculeatus]|uniref:LOW QUALITY PROTEIN: basic proline-rich protein-like n=1 Tax=Tachyglossus aculeatus TaxID=9261 RepID=UPI0018F5F071|nr:LOW QUALITY PROTEIN: basic proline-rich protein-like [Tachyglossus aculeatus]
MPRDDSLDTRMKESVGVFHALGPRSHAPAGQPALRGPASTSLRKRQTAAGFPGRRLEASFTGYDEGEPSARAVRAQKLGGGAEDQLPSWSRAAEDPRSVPFPSRDPEREPRGPVGRHSYPVAGPPPAHRAPLPGSRVPSGLAAPDPAGDAHHGLPPRPHLTIPRLSRPGSPSRDGSWQPLPWRLSTVPEPVRSRPIGKDQRPAREAMKLRAQRERETRCPPCPPSPPRDIWDVGPRVAPYDPCPSDGARPFSGPDWPPEKSSREDALPGNSSRRCESLGPGTSPKDIELLLAEFQIPPLLSPLSDDDTPEGPRNPTPPRPVRGGKAFGTSNPANGSAVSPAGSSRPERALASSPEPGSSSVDSAKELKDSRIRPLHPARGEDAGPASELQAQSLIVPAQRQDSGRPSAPDSRARRPSWTRNETDSGLVPFSLPSAERAPLGPALRKPQPPAGAPMAHPDPLSVSRVESGLPAQDPAGGAPPRPPPSLAIRGSRSGAPSLDLSWQPLPWRLPTLPEPVSSLPIGEGQRPAREAMKLRAQREREIRCPPCPPSPPRDIWDVWPCLAPYDPVRSDGALPRCRAGSAPEQPNREDGLPRRSTGSLDSLAAQERETGPVTSPVDIEKALAELRILPLLSPLSEDESPGGPRTPKATGAVQAGKAREACTPGQGAAGLLPGSRGPERALAATRPASTSVDQANGLRELRTAPRRPPPRGGAVPECPRGTDVKPSTDADGYQAHAMHETRSSTRDKRAESLGQAQHSPLGANRDTKGPLQSEDERPGKEATGGRTRANRPKGSWGWSHVWAPRDGNADGCRPSPEEGNEPPLLDRPVEEKGKWRRPWRKRSRSREELSPQPGKRARGPLASHPQRSLEVSPGVASTGLGPCDLAAFRGGRGGSGGTRPPSQTPRLQVRSPEAAAPGKDSGQPAAPEVRFEKPDGSDEAQRSPPTRKSKHSRLALRCPLPAAGRPPLLPAPRAPPQPPAGPLSAEPAPLPGPRSHAQPRLPPPPQLPLPSSRPRAPVPIDFSSQPLPWRLPTVPGPVRSLPIPKDLRPVREAMKRRAQRAQTFLNQACKSWVHYLLTPDSWSLLLCLDLSLEAEPVATSCQLEVWKQHPESEVTQT